MTTLGEFLRNRRGRIRPADVGFPPRTGRRQTPGLRREELAALAGVSVDYYIRLEQGRDTHPSAGVLDALATALRLDDDERTHLHALTKPPAKNKASKVARPELLKLLEVVRPAPAYVLTPTSDILAANPEGEAVLVGISRWPPQGRNLVRYVFTQPEARGVFVSWRQMAEDCVAHLRTVTTGPELDALVNDLIADSAEFAELWQHYDVRVKSGARRTFEHPAVGRFELTSEILTAPDGQRFAVFQAAANTPDADALTLLSMALQPQ